MNRISLLSLSVICATAVSAQSKLHVGGYGEVAYSRNFYSDHMSRYTQPDEHKNDPSNGRFDIPHAVIYMGYDFGRGWSFGTEIEFEHGGTGSAYEKENEEGGEWEQEQEKGGEVELEQFWIQKTFSKALNLRAGHIVVPVGLNNAHHEPTHFFTVYRPEGENTILPSTWHQTGVELWGRYKDFRYELQFLAGLNADHFTTTGWINKGNSSPLEFEIATKYGASLRIDNYTVPGLRMAVSGYYGHAIGNSYPANKNGVEAEYDGAVAVGSFDFTYDAHNLIVRGQADYGYFGDAAEISYLYNRTNKKSPYHHSTPVSSNAYSIGIEAGYDILSLFPKHKEKDEKLHLFARYEHYNSCASTRVKQYDYNDIQRIAVGVNYRPLKQLVVKGEYSHRFLKAKYNNEPSVNLGIAYEGWFL